MKETVNVSARCNPAVLAEAEHLFAELGFTLEEAFNLFLAKTAELGDLLFDMNTAELSRTEE